MKLIDFDGAFEAYLQDWFMRSKGLFRTYDEMEDRVPEVYQTFLDTPADFLNGEKPGAFFERFSDPKELTDWMVAYEKGGVPVPDMLLNRISDLGRAAEKSLLSLLTAEGVPQASRMSAVTLLREVDSAAVYVNASTRFTDGGEFGMGCEMGISTQKLHARGPMGLRELCTWKYVIHGNGQVR